MPTAEERLAHLEGRVAEHSTMFTEIRESIRHLEHRMDAGFEQVHRRFESMDAKFDARFTAIDGRFTAVDDRFTAIDGRFTAIERRFMAIDDRFDALDQKISRQFVWLTGMMLTLLIAVVGAMLARL